MPNWNIAKTKQELRDLDTSTLPDNTTRYCYENSKWYSLKPTQTFNDDDELVLNTTDTLKSWVVVNNGLPVVSSVTELDNDYYNGVTAGFCPLVIVLDTLNSIFSVVTNVDLGSGSEWIAISGFGEGVDSPLNVLTPDHKYQRYRDVTTGTIWLAIGLTSNDWVVSAGSGT